MLDPAVEHRILAALNHEEGDRVPIWDFIDNRAIVNHLAPDEPDYDRAMVKVYHALGIDLCRGYGGSYSEDQEGQSGGDDYTEWRISGQTRWEVVHPIRTIEDIFDWQPRPPSANQLNAWVEWNRKQQERFAPYTMWVPGGGCGFHATYGAMGLHLFSLAIYEARDDLERVLWCQNEIAVAFARAAAQANLCPIYFIGDDVAYKNTTMFSPSFLRRTFIPMLARTIDPLHEAGIKVVFHSDGNVMSILDDMLDVGIDGLNPIEPLAGMDIAYLKRRYGKRLVLVGNVDCSQVLPLGSVNNVIEATKECIRAASPGGGHFIGSSSEITPNTPVENILAFYRTVHEYGRYPITI
ncbi:MAG: uroporphyrinogen decarboxylase family protein [Armatimonadota bacterium]